MEFCPTCGTRVDGAVGSLYDPSVHRHFCDVFCHNSFIVDHKVSPPLVEDALDKEEIIRILEDPTTRRVTENVYERYEKGKDDYSSWTTITRLCIKHKLILESDADFCPDCKQERENIKTFRFLLKRV